MSIRVLGCTICFSSPVIWFLASNGELFTLENTAVKRLYSGPTKENTLVWVAYDDKVKKLMVIVDFESTNKEQLEESLDVKEPVPVL